MTSCFFALFFHVFERLRNIIAINSTCSGYMFYLLFVSKFLVMEALSFWKCGSVLESVFFFISSRFLVIFRSFSCSVVFSLDITAGPAGGSRVKICHRLPRRLGRKRMGEPGCPAGSTFSRAWWRTDKPI